MTHILVTGGAGYIGSHTCKLLTQEGFQTVILDDLSSGHLWATRQAKFLHGNLADYELLVDALTTYKIDAVIHFAAHAYVGESMNDPRKYFENNVVNSLTLLRAMLATGVNRIVFSSSCTVYGEPASQPIAENHPKNPTNPYGDSKLFIEKVLAWYDLAHAFRSVSLRYFNAAGADSDGELGELHVPETHLIPLVMDAALGLRPSVDIFGTDYPTPDGTAIRDYIHVEDLANAHWKALEYLLGGGGTTVLNLGTERGHSVGEVIRAVGEVSASHIHVRERERREGDPAALVASARKAKAVLGWTPRYTELRSIVETAWAWHSKGRAAVNTGVQRA